jgi:hypothetical protein
MARFEIYWDQSGEYRWRFRTDNNEGRNTSFLAHDIGDFFQCDHALLDTAYHSLIGLVIRNASASVFTRQAANQTRGGIRLTRNVRSAFVSIRFFAEIIQLGSYSQKG